MFLRARQRKKNGKQQRYFSVVENRRLAGGKHTQRQVLYLGEINDSQEEGWRRTLEVFDEKRRCSERLALFPEDRPLPADALNAVHVRLEQMELKRPRAFGNCWLACEIWKQLGLDKFWEGKLLAQRGEVPWEKVLQLLVVNRLIAPGSEFHLQREGFDSSAMDQLLGCDFAVAGKDRLYRCLDLLLEHRSEVFQHLRERWCDLFGAQFDVLLYDLTSTYFEGSCEQIPKARHGYSRDGRPDCRQVVIALVVTTDGLPLAYEVLPGNTSDRTTLKDFLKKIEARYGEARRVWVMDRGIPTEAILAEMRQEGVQYIVGTPKGSLSKVEQRFLQMPWRLVHEGVMVKLLEQDAEMLVLAKSAARANKERAMRRRKLRGLFQGLLRLRSQNPTRDRLLQRLGVLKHAAGRAASLVEIRVPGEGQSVTRETFCGRLKAEVFKAVEGRDGHYLLRSNIMGERPEVLWERYVQLTEIEGAFKALESDWAIRPIQPQLEARMEAHIFVAFLAYCLLTTLRKRLQIHAPGLTPRQVLEKLSRIQMLDIWLPTSDGRWLIMPRYTQPETEQQMVLQKLKLALPAQPPPRIRSNGTLIAPDKS